MEHAPIMIHAAANTHANIYVRDNCGHLLPMYYALRMFTTRDIAGRILQARVVEMHTIVLGKFRNIFKPSRYVDYVIQTLLVHRIKIRGQEVDVNGELVQT